MPGGSVRHLPVSILHGTGYVQRHCILKLKVLKSRSDFIFAVSSYFLGCEIKTCTKNVGKCCKICTEVQQCK